ncbi:MAG: UDP-N-acetyl-D-mannosaminuronic acid transferase [Meiothermus sp.]|uniref:UDP-N-acetyl-D-mannosaminuronic acid transferase n=2 Tax=Meiothermus hypogaeus TaxID=884155 RepID=A0A511R5N7_9DEIN|nr:WecB/TagA/CpsF family glycosyltransferase [Meiothermus hypogaeus]RIH79340.1 N-acetylglucosaminyldiphosphoundecaprenol N-acetyl-beta-D-mannosaminyltransferase [Meiothermus hypogaeus]GEM84326.1 UDP-N-acetyl-D-mannosaminuronic acid transferase [Meiothermus hypogaeus NBRC 106114]GIW38333.1 MAG: UDP-N-acetyl-D-mannosaminuronic acid transferase [Meiothermus sp.]
MQRVEILGTPVDLVNLEQTLAWIEEKLTRPLPHCAQIITTNPEAVVRAQSDPTLKQALQESELVTADGVGIVWAVNRLTNHKLADRVPGSEILPAAFARFGSRLRVYFLGALPGVAARAAQNAQTRWGIQVCGVQDGYFKDEEAVVAAIHQAQPDLLVVGMGERQDTFIHRHKARLGARVAIGVGGMIDVLAGEVRRVPRWAQKLKIEWLVRIASDRKRWSRFPRLLKFVRLVLASPRAPRVIR